MSKKTNWLQVAFGLYLISPLSPEDIATGGALIIPSAAFGLGLVARGFRII